MNGDSQQGRMAGRRAFMAGAAALAAGLIAPAPGFAVPVRRRLASRLGVQLYMVGAELQADLTSTLRRLAAIGYRRVEALSLPGISAKALRAGLDSAGLSAPSMHVTLEADYPGSVALTDTDRVVEQARILGATNAVVAFIPFGKALMRRPDARELVADQARLGAALIEIARAMTPEDWADISRTMNECGERLARFGIRVGYHNHNLEFARFANGETALELLLAKTSPAHVDLELDLGWVKAAGVDPAAFLRSHGRRIRQVHLKDLKAAPPNTALTLATATVGRGVQDWKAILRALDATLVENAYVETEPPYEKSGVQAAADGFTFLQPLLRER